MILITRPEPDSIKLSNLLKEKKIICHVDPIISFEYMKLKDTIIKQNSFVIASVQALQAIVENKISENKKFINGEFYIIGKKVKEEAERIGVKNIVKTFYEFSSFAFFLRKQNTINKTQYFSGNVISDSAKELVNEGLLEQSIVYKYVTSKKFSRETLNLFAAKRIKSVALFSKFTAHTYLQLIKHHNLMDYSKQMSYFCLSSNISQYLRDNGFQNLHTSLKADQESLIKLILN